MEKKRYRETVQSFIYQLQRQHFVEAYRLIMWHANVAVVGSKR